MPSPLWSVRGARALIHRRYWRAAVSTLALVAAVGGLATAALELRYGVPARAVVRYFTRLHDDSADLAPLLRQPATMARLASLPLAADGMNAGGIVYTDDGSLSFHPWLPSTAVAASRRSRDREAIYIRLLKKYLDAELNGLVADLLEPEVRRRLQRHGVSPAEIMQLRHLSANSSDPRQRAWLLRRAGRLIRPFVPDGADRYRMSLGDKLGFYGSKSPRGRYLGLYEVRLSPWPAARAAGPAAHPGRILLITLLPDGSIVIDDRTRDRLRRYRLTPVPHPAGLRLYRLTPRA